MPKNQDAYQASYLFEYFTREYKSTLSLKTLYLLPQINYSKSQSNLTSYPTNLTSLKKIVSISLLIFSNSLIP